LAPGPLGLVVSDPDRHRGWLLCPFPVPAAAGWGLRPRVFSAHRPLPQLQVHAPAWSVTPIFWQSVFRPAKASFTCW
jgi:hypothetical protein